MRQYKWVISSFTFYDRTGIQAYLEKQAAKGWLLDRMGQFGWRFRRIGPTKLHFAVTYFPKASAFDPEPSEQQRSMQEFCARAGWILAGTTAQMQIFWNASENPVPIETDASLELENIHASARKGYLPAYFLLLANAIFQGALQISQMRSDFVGYLSANVSVFGCICWLMMLLLCGVELIGYFLWYRKAKRAVALDGSFIATRGFRNLQLVILTVVVLGFALMLLSISGRLVLVALTSLLTVVGTTALVLGISNWLKKMKFSARENRTTTIILAIVLSAILCGAVLTAVISSMDSILPEEDISPDNYRGKTFTARYIELPLSASDLTGLGGSEYETYFRGQSSFLAERYVANELIIEGERILPSVRYVIVKVKAQWLYELCLNDLLNMHRDSYSEDIYGNRTYYDFREITDDRWNADCVYQLCHEANRMTEYLICVDNQILNIEFSWEPTDEQIQMVMETLLH